MRTGIFSAEDAPAYALAIARVVVPQLLQGDHPYVALLRRQFDHAQVKDLELTGCGFFLNFHVPEDLPRVDPGELAGGDAQMEIAGLRYPAGCVLFVHNGCLATFEVYSFDGTWPENATLQGVNDVFPLLPPATDPTHPHDEENSR